MKHDFCLETVRARLDGAPFSVRVFESLPSTNEHLLALAREGEAEGTVIVSEMQTAGRGRSSRSFFSPADTGLYLSVLLRERARAIDATRLVAIAAVAAARAAEGLGAEEVRIKWVNDLYRAGKKCCGILAQGIYSQGQAQAVVLGFGFNVFAPQGGFPDSLSTRAGALFDTPREGLREALCAELLCGLSRALDAPSAPLIEEYRARSCVLSRTVQVLRAGESFPATAEAIDDECRLLVRDGAGRLHTLTDGEVSLLL